MSGRGIIYRIIGLTAVSLPALLGCDTLHKAGVPGLEQYAKVDHEGLALEQSNREKFSVHRDHKALYWLLANRISNGMRLQEVEEILGESGEYTTDFKSNDSKGLHQTTDSVYKWGPDSTGKSVVLFFRDGHVCNFNAKYYKDP
jgi:hypothetical protein